MQNNAQIRQTVEKALHLQGNRLLTDDELKSIGRELGIDAEFIEEAAKQVYEGQRRQKKGRQLIVGLLAMSMLVVGGSFTVVVVGVFVVVPSVSQQRHEPYFAQQITLVAKAAQYLDEANQEALDENIAAFHQTKDLREKLDLMTQINAGLKHAVFFKSKIGDARAQAILASNRDLRRHFFFAKH